MKSSLDIRPSPIAGQWYTDDPSLLAQSVDRYLAPSPEPEVTGRVVAVVAPHAGHLYSGPVAGYAFAAVRALKPGVVAVVSPMHHPYPQPLLTTSHQAYATPLGAIPVDSSLVARLSHALELRLGYGLSPVARDPEHALEIELPFLQRALGGEFRLVPVMMRDQGARVAHALGEALGEILQGQESLLVASSDLSHFYPQKIAESYDQEMLRRIAAFDPQAVLDAEESGEAFACGRGAIAAVLWAARELGADQVQVLRYRTSGDVTGDTSSVVGYGAAVVTSSQG